MLTQPSSSFGPSYTSSMKEEDEGLFPAFDEIPHGSLLNVPLNGNTISLTHGFHRFPAKYIPQIPRWALREFAQPHSVVLDPFMGSGTTLVESLRKVNKAYGIDIDPLASLISSAKIQKYNLIKINELAAQLLNTQGRKVPLYLPMEGVENVQHWFSPQNWQDLCNLHSLILGLKCSEGERSFFLCIFSSILRWVSNADDQSQKTYVSGTLKKSPPLVWPTFKKALDKAVRGIEELDVERKANSANILKGSALNIPLAENEVDLIVTSPPYLDSVDYMYNFMMEYFWLGPLLGIPTRSDFNKNRRLSLGSKNPMKGNDQLPSCLENLVKIEDIPEYRKESTVSYLRGMGQHFSEAARVLKDEGRYVLVIGNSQANNGQLPIHESLLRLAKEEGLHLEKAFAYRIRRHYMKFPRKGRGGIILVDWVITLRKTTRALIRNEDSLPFLDVRIGHDEVAN